MAKKYHGSRPMKNGDASVDHMVKNDNSQIANMPQEKMMKSYPYPSMMEENYNDGISGIDSEMSASHSKLRAQYKPRKF